MHCPGVITMSPLCLHSYSFPLLGGVATAFEVFAAPLYREIRISKSELRFAVCFVVGSDSDARPVLVVLRKPFNNENNIFLVISSPLSEHVADNSVINLPGSDEPSLSVSTVKL